MWRDHREQPDSQDDRPREPPCVLRGRTERQLRSAMNDVWLWRKLTSGFAIVAAFDDEGVTDADGTVPVAVAVPGADHVKGRAGCRQLEILLEAAAQQDCPSGAGGERQIMQGLHEIRDRVASSLRCGDRVESLLSDHGGHAHASITDVGDVQSAEDRVTGTGIDGVGTDRALVEVGFGVAGPAVVAQGQEVVQLEEDLPLDSQCACGIRLMASHFPALSMPPSARRTTLRFLRMAASLQRLVTTTASVFGSRLPIVLVGGSWAPKPPSLTRSPGKSGS